MGPERVLPNSEDELGEDERPADGALLPVWSGGEGGAEEGGEMELDGEEEEEEEEVNNGGYYYQPLNQEPDGVSSSEQPGEEGEEAPSHTEQLQQVQHRIEVSSARQQLTHCFTPGQDVLLKGGHSLLPHRHIYLYYRVHLSLSPSPVSLTCLSPVCLSCR